MVIVIDNDDNVLEPANKYVTHKWVNLIEPKNMLHRAFSVFLFNSKNELLLQQRASSKITFPDVWTNTCCSHPLHCPEELDATNDQIGVKRAAVRKLEQELGIKVGTIAPEKFRYLTRMHYKAPYIPGYGPLTESTPTPEWGEHEIDYILFVKADVELQPHPDEVRDTQYVTPPKLKELMQKDSGLIWSPWFRKIVDQFFDTWTKDIDETINTEKCVDLNTIHRL